MTEPRVTRRDDICRVCGCVRHNVSHHDDAERLRQVRDVYHGYDYYREAGVVFHPFVDERRSGGDRRK